MIKLPFDIDNLIDDLRIFSWEANDILIRYCRMLRDPQMKSNIIGNINVNDPVTIADLEVNQLIIRRINEKYKNMNWEILSEENAKLDPLNSDFNSDWLWILDPLDGTKDFLQGTGDYAMHLALNYKNKPYLGIVLVPEKNELWFSNGAEIWCEDRKRNHKRINISKKKSLRDMTIVTSKNHKNEVLNKLINLIEFKENIVMGSVGCKITSILRGESDIYISLSLPGNSAPKDWDFAAPSAILQAAGGSITNLDNMEICFNQRDFELGGIIIASSNKKFHGELCHQIKEIIQKYNIYPIDS